MSEISGIHHVTAISGPASANVVFWRDMLGLRFVKRTVNFDDPTTYHLYYGDELGRPGTAMTFFPWEGLPTGSRGTGEVARTQFAVPAGSLGWWARHLDLRGVAGQTVERFGAPALHLRAPDGLDFALVEAADDERSGWIAPGFEDEVAVKGFRAVTLALADPAATAELLTGLLGYKEVGSDGATRRLTTGSREGARFVDLEASGEPLARAGVGSVHHVAFSVADREAQNVVRRRLAEAGFAVTPSIDRDYFHAIYFRSPGGVLFEVATDEPGFTVDEPAAELGTALKLPKQHAHRRAELERALPELP